MKRNEVKILAGAEELLLSPLAPFSEEAVRFLEELSGRIRKDKAAAGCPDVLTFGFYIRKANIERLKDSYSNISNRLGRGMVFHIAPSNVPVNFTFSYVFGLLAGNANVVRVSSKNFLQVAILSRIIKEILMQPGYEEVAARTQIISYPKNKEITDYYSSICNARIIWGGDATIHEIRKSPIPPRCMEITFADRYSLGMLSPKQVLSMPEEALIKLSQDFYNDTYLMDQNACSAPHLILWERGKSKITGQLLKEAKERFWAAVFKTSLKYDLEPVKVSEKFGLLCETAAQNDSVMEIRRYDNRLYVITLSKLTQPLESYRGKFGMFYEYDIENIEDIFPLIDEKVQTLAVFGADAFDIQQQIIKQKVKGIDRIVPFGKTLDIGLIWDGYDIIETLSRVVSLK